MGLWFGFVVGRSWASIMIASLEEIKTGLVRACNRQQALSGVPE